MEKTIYNTLAKYVLEEMSSFHTPGHKGHMMVKENLWDLDLTELPATDSLYSANGAILQSELRLQKLFGTKRTLISCGGDTLCIQTMIRLASMYTNKFIVSRNVHRSVVSTMALLGIQPKWILPKGDSGEGTPGRVNSQDVAKTLADQGGKCAVYITSPDYYGVMSDVSAISKECKKWDSILLVDNAHGTHLKFLKESMHPIDLGATMSADSAHKTLPVLTGGALLQIADESLSIDAKQAMALFGSTSPSYPIMASLDVCTEYLLERGHKDFSRLENKVSEIKKLAKSKSILMPTGLCDPTRMSFMTSSIGYNGNEFAEYLRKFKIEPEFSDKNYVVLIPSPFNSKMDWDRLENALLSIDKLKNIKLLNSTENLKYRLPEVKMTLRETIMSKRTKLNVDNAIGKIAGEIVCPCPPGVPVVMPGEVISDYERDALKTYGISEIYVVE